MPQTTRICCVKDCKHPESRLNWCTGPSLLRNLWNLHETRAYLTDEDLEDLKERVRSQRGQGCLTGPDTYFHQQCFGRHDLLEFNNSWYHGEINKDEKSYLIRDIRHFACDNCLTDVLDSKDVKYTDASGKFLKPSGSCFSILNLRQ